MILTRHAGQELLDLLSALSLGASALVVARWGIATILRSRLVFVFGGLCVFFAIRAAADHFDSAGLDALDQSIACAMPLAALLLVEGVLRRHAPRALKALVVFGGLAVAIVLRVPATHALATLYALGGFVVLSLVCTIALLALRDRSSLSRQENAGLDALAIPGVVLTLLTVTDFLPHAPIGLSDVGSALLAYVLAANPTTRSAARGVIGELLVVVLVAAGSEPAFAWTFGLAALAEHVRLGAILLALLLAAAAVLRVREARERRSTQSFTRALTSADTNGVDAFLNSLADQPLMAGLRLAEDAQLAEYDCGGLGRMLAARNVWTRAALADDHSFAPERPREELADLMARTEATHAVMISHDPLRIALFTLPGGGEIGVLETDLALFGKLAAIAAREHVCV